MLLLPPLAHAQAHRTWKLAFLGFESLPESHARAFAEGLQAFGYVEGQNLIVERRLTGGVNERAPALAAELLRSNPDVVLTLGGHAAHAMKQATKSVPIVSLNVSDHVRVGLARSRARPGGNLTGMDVIAADLTLKLIELLKEANPALSRVAILGVATGPGHGVLEEPAAEAASRLGITTHRATVRAPADYEAALKELASARSEAILLLPDPTNAVMRKTICAFAAERRIAAIGVWDYYPQAGCLMSYGPIRVEIFRRAGYFIDKVLKGGNPAEIPIEQPTRYELVLNVKTAAALELATQRTLSLRADRIVE